VLKPGEDRGAFAGLAAWTGGAVGRRSPTRGRDSYSRQTHQFKQARKGHPDAYYTFILKNQDKKNTAEWISLGQKRSLVQIILTHLAV